MTRRFPTRSRTAALGLLGLLGGMIAGVAAAGDIESSFGKGRIAPAAPVPVAPTDPASAATGYELAGWLGLRTRDDCRTLEPALRVGCADHVSRGRAGAPGAVDLPL